MSIPPKGASLTMAKLVNIINVIGEKCKSTSPSNARMLVKHGLAIPTDTMIDGHFTIKLTTVSRCSAFRQLNQTAPQQKKNICWDCGVQIEDSLLHKRCWCEICAEKRSSEADQELSAYAVLRAKFMLERAMRLLENQDFRVDVWDYQEAQGVIRDRLQQEPGAFDSAHEIVAAMELINNRITTKVHPVVAGRKPDFMLPDLNVILEIDGYLHEFKPVKDKEFDLLVRKELGPQWEVIRIPTEYIELNIKQLVSAIKELYDEMQRQRECNDGVLPSSFSFRDASFSKSLRKRKNKKDGLYDEEWLWENQ